MIVSMVEQGSPEWLEARAGVVTASKFSTVMAKGRGNAPSKTRTDYLYRLANERLTGLPVTEGFKSAYMERGNQLESEARALYAWATDTNVDQVGHVFTGGGQIGCSPDGLIGEDGGLEIKCPAIHTHTAYVVGCLARGQIPPEYVAQVQGSMWVCEREWWDFMTFHPESARIAKIVRVKRDEKFIKSLSAEVDRFLADLSEIVEKLEDDSDG